MPVDPTPEGGEVFHRPIEQPFPPAQFEASTQGVAEPGGHDARDEEDSRQALANRELDQQTGLARPPLGN
ncbi:MAG: hypothetical protein V4731_00025 [Pseudomonadota bacterium]